MPARALARFEAVNVPSAFEIYIGLWATKKVLASDTNRIGRGNQQLIRHVEPLKVSEGAAHPFLLDEEKLSIT
jgi:hypothetical protein